MRGTIRERFEAKVRKTKGCWWWTACRIKHGYGMLSVFGKNRAAHRMSWVLHRGSIPEGMLVCHSCDNPGCVNPAHLFLGTQKDNIRDCLAKGRMGRKLQDDDVREIRAAVAGGHTQVSQAKKYRVSKVAISCIINRKRWAHVEDVGVEPLRGHG